MKFKSSISILSFQICTLAFQLAYAAFSSRLAAPSEFGYYASGLAVQAIFALVFSSGFAEDVIRNHNLKISRMGEITSRALTTGAVAFLLVLALGYVMNIFIGISIELVIMTSVISGLTPLQNLLLGCFSQQRMLTLSSFLAFSSAVAGFLVGALFLKISPSASSLMASPLVASLLFVSFGCLKYKSSLFPLEKPSWTNVRPSKFAFRIFLYRVFWFLNSNLSRWTLIFGGHQPILGHLNRSEVISSVPIQQLQSSIVNPFYPRAAILAKSVSGENQIRLLLTKATGSLIFLSWTIFTICALGIQNLVAILLGGNWSIAAIVAPLLFAIGALQIPVVILSTVVETQLLFRKAYLAESFLLLLQGAALVVYFGNIGNLTFIILLMGIVMALRFIIYMRILAERKLVDSYSISIYSLVALLASMCFGLLHKLTSFTLISMSLPDSFVSLLASSILGLVWLCLLLLTRRGKNLLKDFSWLIKEG